MLVDLIFNQFVQLYSSKQEILLTQTLTVKSVSTEHLVDFVAVTGNASIFIQD